MAQFEHKGYNIDVRSNGTFEAKVGDVTIIKPTLRETQEQIDKETTSAASRKHVRLLVCGILSKNRGWMGKVFAPEDRVWIATVTGVNRTTRALQLEGVPKDHELKFVLADSQANKDLLQDLLDQTRILERTQDLYKARQVVVEGYGRIEAGDYNGVLARLEESYLKSKGEKEKTA